MTNIQLGPLSRAARWRKRNEVAAARTRVHVKKPGSKPPEVIAAGKRLRAAISALAVWESVEVDTGPIIAVRDSISYATRAIGVKVKAQHLGPARWRLTRTD